WSQPADEAAVRRQTPAQSRSAWRAMPAATRAVKDQRGSADADGERRPAQCWKRMAQRGELWQQRPRFGAGQSDAAEVSQLARQDREGDAAGESDRHRMRNVANE